VNHYAWLYGPQLRDPWRPAYESGGIAVLCKNVIIAQGHAFPFNNWWVGSPNMKLEDVNGRRMLVQQCEGGWIRTAIGGVDNNNFDVYIMAYDKH
jgi:hypothetical protein